MYNEPMTTDKKLLNEHERAQGVVILTEGIKNKALTDEQFQAMLDDPETPRAYVGYDDRKQWLKDNGYRFTRANMANSDLPSKPKAV